MILVTGGCRSGKSEYGERLVEAMGNRRLYVATGQVFDEEMARRVDKHRLRRGELWTTHEGYRELENLDYEGFDGILLDSITSMVTNLLFDFIGEDETDFSEVDYHGAEARSSGDAAGPRISGYSRPGKSISGLRGIAGLFCNQRPAGTD